MNNDIDTQEAFLKVFQEIRIFLKQFFWNKSWLLVIMIIISLFTSFAYTNNQIAQNRYDPNLKDVFDVKSSLVIGYADKPSQTIYLENNFTLMVKDESANVLTETYYFEITDLNLTATWNSFYIYFQIEEKAFQSFNSIQSNVYIEDKEDFIKKDKFSKSSEGLPFYIARLDIDRFMFKEAVPNHVQATIKFSSL
jgi:hypothetical protein